MSGMTDNRSNPISFLLPRPKQKAFPDPYNKICLLS